MVQLYELNFLCLATSVTSTFCSDSVLLKVNKKQHKQSISMATTSIMHGYVTTQARFTTTQLYTQNGLAV